ncbi:nuclear receptor coactivator 5 isoform X1 [Lutzomyia longipalpis]|uniref:nuclear receptor coactivator 5 isoform X1 n=2 Tax=Lutzomyia longipalpis TaxID=7200 RepID=UPI002483529F|nr:nuclear receptor coactivator 5 isoform X1 [Lutzomyia longipalpis]
MDLSFIRDPATVRSRVYVGALAEGTTRKEMEDYFQKYGSIVGVVVNRGFGFIQFESEECAAAVLQDKHGMIHGKKIFVKPAQTGIGSNRPAAQNNVPKPTGVWDAADPSQPPPMAPAPIPWTGAYLRKPDFGAGLMNIPPISYPSWMVVPGRNDCEIIVVSKALTAYAEAIESHLKRLGLLVDLLYPNDDVPIGKVLGNISSRGCLYAVLVTPQNEEHRSITVNILYGQPAEHRNMPVEDAIKFIAENFREKVKRDTIASQAALPTPIATTQALPITPIATHTLKDKHPDHIQSLLVLLAENRMVTVLQYDKIIKYLNERREMQLKVELGDEAGTATAILEEQAQHQKKQQQELDLQQKILSILNGPSITGSSATNTKPPLAPDNPNRENTIRLLQDPKVQKALDTVLKSTLLQSLDVSF